MFVGHGPLAQFDHLPQQRDGLSEIALRAATGG
jgi:hypothetical protein